MAPYPAGRAAIVEHQAMTASHVRSPRTCRSMARLENLAKDQNRERVAAYLGGGHAPTAFRRLREGADGWVD